VCALTALVGSVTVAGCDTPVDSDAIRPTGDDDFTVIQDAIDRMHQAGGGTVRCFADATYRCRRAPVILDRVTLDLNGATIELSLGDGNDQGIRLRSHAVLCRGTIRVQSRGKPSLQGGAHAPVCVGPLYGEGGTADTPSPDEGVTGWAIRDLTLSSDKSVPISGGTVGAVAIQIMGGASNGIIERITVPDNTTMAGAIHLDWGVVGAIQSADDVPGLSAARRIHASGAGWTTHPHHIVIRDIKVGRLTGDRGGSDGGAGAIRLSGCHDITVTRVRARATKGDFLLHTAGDLGFEYAAQPAELTGTTFSECSVDDCGGRLFVSDSLADNVARGVARGYRPRRIPLLTTDVAFRKVMGTGRGNLPGGVFLHQRGGRADRCSARGFTVGFVCDADANDIVLADCVAKFNREAGFLIEHVNAPPRDCRLVHVLAEDNGGGRAGSANIVIGASIGTIVDGGTIGTATGRDAASFGIRVKERRDGCIDATITGDPLIRSHAVNGAAIQASSREGWGALRLFTGARYGVAVTRRWVGLSVVPVAIDTAGRRTFEVMTDVNVPPDFPHQPGDTFRMAITS
jgi:hypothetical protein